MLTTAERKRRTEDLLKLLEGRSLSVKEMVEEAFCAKLGVMPHTLRSACEAALRQGLLEAVFSEGVAPSFGGDRRRTKVKRYSVKQCTSQ